MFERAAGWTRARRCRLGRAGQPNINDFEMDRGVQTADEFAKSAGADGDANRERAYAEALTRRYSSDPAADLKKLQVDYKDAMAALAQAYPSDLDAQVLYAESLMDLRPWQLWTRDGRPSDVTEEVVRVLESVLKQSPLHPGANHYYIHTMEASPSPDKALAAAKRLETLVPAAGHSHAGAHLRAPTVCRVGQQQRHRRASRALHEGTNTRSGMYPLMYTTTTSTSSHAAAMASSSSARGWPTPTANVAPVIAEMPMLEGFIPQQLYVRCMRRWTDLAIPAPRRAAAAADRRLALRPWAAFAATRSLARAEQQVFMGSWPRSRRDSVGVLNTAGRMFAVASRFSPGCIAVAAGDLTTAIAETGAAVAAESADLRRAADVVPGGRRWAPRF